MPISKKIAFKNKPNPNSFGQYVFQTTLGDELNLGNSITTENWDIVNQLDSHHDDYSPSIVIENGNAIWSPTSLPSSEVSDILLSGNHIALKWTKEPLELGATYQITINVVSADPQGALFINQSNPPDNFLNLPPIFMNGETGMHTIFFTPYDRTELLIFNSGYDDNIVVNYISIKKVESSAFANPIKLNLPMGGSPAVIYDLDILQNVQYGEIPPNGNYWDYQNNQGYGEGLTIGYDDDTLEQLLRQYGSNTNLLVDIDISSGTHTNLLRYYQSGADWNGLGDKKWGVFAGSLQKIFSVSFYTEEMAELREEVFNYENSDSVPSSLDKFREQDLYAKSIGNNINEQILSSNRYITCEDIADEIPLSYLGDTAIEIIELDIGERGGASDHSTKDVVVQGWMFDGNSGKDLLYNSSNNLRSYDDIYDNIKVFGADMQYACIFYDKLPDFDNDTGGPGKIIQNTIILSNLAAEQPLYNLELPQDHTNHQYGEPNGSSGTDISFDPNAFGELTSILEEDDTIYNPIYFVFWLHGDHRKPGPGNDKKRKSRFYVCELNQIPIWNDGLGIDGNTEQYFEFSESDFDVKEEDDSDADMSNMRVKKFIVRIANIGTDFEAIPAQYQQYASEVLPRSIPLKYDRLYETEDILTISPLNEINANITYPCEQMDEYTDWEPVSKVSIGSSYDSAGNLQVYDEDEFIKLSKSSPATINLDFDVSLLDKNKDIHELIVGSYQSFSEFIFYVIDWDDVDNKFKNWNDVIDDYPTSLDSLVSKQNDNTYFFNKFGTPLTNVYGTPGIKNIKAVVFNYDYRESAITPIRWKLVHVKFFLNIPITEFADFSELGGNDYITIPYPNSSPVLNGVSQDSKYYSSIRKVLSSGTLNDADVIEEQSLIEALNNDELGKNIQSMDLEQTRYFKRSYDIYELLNIEAVQDNQLISYNEYDGETSDRTFPMESSIGQIFINDTLDSDLIQNCVFEFNGENLDGKSVYDSSGRGNKGFLLGDYKLKKTKGSPIRRDSFIQVPKKGKENGAM